MFVDIFTRKKRGETAIPGHGLWGTNFDFSPSKTVKIDETNSVQVRVDARNVLNHPILGNPNLSINSSDFGRIPADQVTGARQFQAQLRFSF